MKYTIYERTYHAAYLAYIGAWQIYESDGLSVRTVAYEDTIEDILKRAKEDNSNVIFDI